MQKALLVISLITIAAFVLVGCNPGGKPDKGTAKISGAGEAVICPVMGTKITKDKAYDMMEYKGKPYYFCCAGCKPAFEKNPEKYIKT